MGRTDLYRVCKTRRTSQKGLGMIEALVALVVLSVGMLGIAALFVTTLHAGSSSISRMQAVNLVNDMADRIRANPLAGLAYDTTVTQPFNNGCASPVPIPCLAVALAADDLLRWNQQITRAWPSAGAANGIITVVDTGVAGQFIYKIQVSWFESDQVNTPLLYSLTIQL